MGGDYASVRSVAQIEVCLGNVSCISLASFALRVGEKGRSKRGKNTSLTHSRDISGYNFISKLFFVCSFQLRLLKAESV